MHRLLLTAAIALIACAVPASAHAARCSDPVASVSAQAATLKVGQTQTFDGVLCFDSTPDRYETQVYSVSVDNAGQVLTESPVESATSIALAGARGPIALGATFTAQQPGTYLLRVRYFAAGKTNPELIGEALWRVTGGASQTVPASATGQQANASAVPAVQITPDDPTPDPQGQTQRVRLGVRVRAHTTGAGRAVWALRVANNGPVAARGVIACQRIPAGARFVKASAPVNFAGDRACVNLGVLGAGRARTVTVTVRPDARAQRVAVLVNATNADGVSATAHVRA